MIARTGHTVRKQSPRSRARTSRELQGLCPPRWPGSKSYQRPRQDGSREAGWSLEGVIQRTAGGGAERPAKGESPRFSASIVYRWIPASRFPILTVLSLIPVDGSIWFHVRGSTYALAKKGGGQRGPALQARSQAARMSGRGLRRHGAGGSKTGHQSWWRRRWRCGSRPWHAVAGAVP